MIFRSLGNPFFSFTGVMKIDSFYREIDVGRTHLYLCFAALEFYGVHIMTCSSNMVASPYWKVSLNKKHRRFLNQNQASLLRRELRPYIISYHILIK